MKSCLICFCVSEEENQTGWTMSSMASTTKIIASLIIANTNVYTKKNYSASMLVNLIEFRICFEKLPSRKNKTEKNNDSIY